MVTVLLRKDTESGLQARWTPIPGPFGRLTPFTALRYDQFNTNFPWSNPACLLLRLTSM